MSDLFKFATPNWIPFSFRLGGPHGFAYVRLPGYRYICWNLDPDHDEVVEAEWLRFTITRPETAEEEEARIDAESEAAYEAHCADFYSY